MSENEVVHIHHHYHHNVAQSGNAGETLTLAAAFIRQLDPLEVEGQALNELGWNGDDTPTQAILNYIAELLDAAGS